MKNITTTLAALMLCFMAFCQDWAPLEATEKYTIYFAQYRHQSPEDGIDHQRIIFRYENHTPNELVLTFNREVQYSPEGTSIHQEKNYEVVIPPGGMTEYGPDAVYDKTFYLFLKDNKGTIKRALMDFKLTNLQVN